MSFGEGSFLREFNKETEKKEKESSIYDKARKDADVFLEEFEFAKKEEIVEIIPEKEKNEIPVFISPGWGVEPESQKETLETMALLFLAKNMFCWSKIC